MGFGVDFTMKSEWEEPPEKDFAELLEVIKDSFRLGASVLRGTAKEKLIERINVDVYDVFDPKEYERRYENGGLLDVDSAVTFDFDEYGNDAVFYANVIMDYHPDGNQWQWENPASGDALISRIESGNEYEWNREPGPRPYWTNFVDRMLNYAGGFEEAGQRIADDLRTQGMEVTFDGVMDVEANTGDGQYDHVY